MKTLYKLNEVGGLRLYDSGFVILEQIIAVHINEVPNIGTVLVITLIGGTRELHMKKEKATKMMNKLHDVLAILDDYYTTN